MITSTWRPAVVLAGALLAAAAVGAPAAAGSGSVSAPVGHTVHYMAPFHPGSQPGASQRSHRGGGGGGSSNLTYHGGNIQATPHVYIVYWGWTPPTAPATSASDPSGEADIQSRFLTGMNDKTETWSTSTTQYCQSTSPGSTSGVVVTTGTTNCPVTFPTATFVHQPGLTVSTWSDTSNTPPQRAGQSQIAAEAASAAAHFSNLGSTDAYSPNAQYIIDFPHGISPSGFGTQYCAWHSSTSTSAGTIGYTNFPYITDAGASCGANFVSAPTDGITIVGGHEYAETLTDVFPNGGWLDSGGAENGDKCAWSPQSTDIPLNNVLYAVQPLWSNSANGGSGGCVITYP